jgi:hypothetical protein
MLFGLVCQNVFGTDWIDPQVLNGDDLIFGVLVVEEAGEPPTMGKQLVNFFL